MPDIPTIPGLFDDVQKKKKNEVPMIDDLFDNVQLKEFERPLHVKIGDAIAAGTLKGIGGILKTPDLVAGAAYDLLTTPGNLIAKATQKPQSPSYNQIKNSPLNPVSGLTKLGDTMMNMGNQASPLQKYEKGIVESMRQGNYAKAGEQILLSLAENVPQFGFQIASILTGNPEAGLAMMGASAAGQQYHNLQDVNMTEGDKRLNAALNGLNEMAWERFFSNPMIKQAVKNPAVKSEIQKGFKNALKTMAKDAGKEGFSEGATQVTGNAIDKATKNPNFKGYTEGGGDAALIGAIFGAGTGIHDYGTSPTKINAPVEVKPGNKNVAGKQAAYARPGQVEGVMVHPQQESLDNIMANLKTHGLDKQAAVSKSQEGNYHVKVSIRGIYYEAIVDKTGKVAVYNQPQNGGVKQGADQKELTGQPQLPEAENNLIDYKPDTRLIWQRTQAEVQKMNLSPEMHKEMVKRALDRGESVPQEVLKDYPDLVQRPVEPEAAVETKHLIEPEEIPETKQPIVEPEPIQQPAENTPNQVTNVEMGKGEEVPTLESVPNQEEPDSTEGHPSKEATIAATKLRGLAKSMQAKIDAKRNPAIASQNPTARRARIAAGMASEADHLEALQQKINLVADAIENNSLPESMKKITQKTHFETLGSILREAQVKRYQAAQGRGQQVDWERKESLSEEDVKFATPFPSVHRDHLKNLIEWIKGKKGSATPRKALESGVMSRNVVVGLSAQQTQALSQLLTLAKGHEKDYSYEHLKDSLAKYKRLQKMGVESTEDLHQLLKDYLSVTRGVKARQADPIKEAERKLIGTKIPGYFPTPKAIVSEMVKKAAAEPGMSVLEPSAGKGNIADILKESGIEPDVIEVNHTLREILSAKGHKLVGTDFLEHTGEYDRIVMNPPFENGQEIDHVRHAYRLLKPGGKIVSIMSEGPFFRSMKKDTEFREWLDEVGGTSEKLPEGSFKSGERPTGVATRMVVIEKPELKAVDGPKQNTLPMEERTFENVADRKVNSYQYEHPELKPFIQEQAVLLKQEVRDSIKGERFAIKDSQGYIQGFTGTKKMVSESVARIQNATGATYAQIEDALDRIIHDHGQENVALAKKIELVIDDMLTKGYRTFDGYDIPPHEEYVRARNQSEGQVGIAPNSGSSHYDMGGYADRNSSYSENVGSAIEMPELVEIAKKLNEGKYPHIREHLDRSGRANGVFRINGTRGQIDLRADIFEGQRLGIYEVTPLKLKETVEKLREKYKHDDKVVVKSVWGKEKGRFEVVVLKKDPTLAAKVLAHEIGHLIDWLPDKDMARGNILGRLASLKKHMKTMIQALPTEGLLPGKVGLTEPNGEMITRKQVMNELQDLTVTWKPFNPTLDPAYTAYRFSAPELYADAISVLFNEPKLLREKAPTFLRAFMNYLDRKPEVKAIYEEIQNRNTNRTAVNAKRLADIQHMFEKDAEIRNRLYHEREREVESIVDSAIRLLVDRDHGILKKVRQFEAVGGVEASIASRTRYTLEESRYISSEVENYLYEVNEGILNPLQEWGLSLDDAGTYLFLKRVQTEREEMANPLGQTKKTAGETLEVFRRRIGDERYARLENIVAKYRSLREKLIIPRVENARMYSAELLETMKDSKKYARFSVLNYLEKRYGKSETARVYKQVGTLAEISNPFVATVLQDISMIRAAKLNEAKSAVVYMLKELAPESITDAEMVYSLDRGGMIAKEPVDPRKGMITIMVDGKPSYYYVSRDIAKTFEEKPFEATKAAQVWSLIMQPLRDILVSKNPFWMVRNVIRDFETTVKNIPEVSVTKIPRLMQKYTEAYREAWRTVMFGERSADVSKMMRGWMLTADRAYSGREKNFDNEIERLAQDFSLNAIDHRRSKFSTKTVYNFLNRVGRVSELGGKIAGYKFLKEYSSRSEREIAHIVRTRVGTPDYKRQGELQAITNNVFLFSNVGKEGLRSSWESFKDDKGAYIFKTILFNILPKLLLVGASLAGPDLLKEIIEGVTEYDKRMYTIIPLGLNQNRESVYLRLPEDYDGQLWGALTWDIANGKILGHGGVADTLAEQNPYKLNPLLQAGKDLFQYYIQGVNPYDDYRGRTVIPYYTYQDGGWKANQALLGYEWKSLGGSVIYDPGGIFTYAETPFEKILRIPPFNVLGTFLKVTDYGHVEKEENAN